MQVITRPVLLSTYAVMPEVLRWETGGTVIGLMPDSEYREGSFDLQAGDIAKMRSGVKSG